MKLKNIVIGCAVLLVIACIAGGAFVVFGGKALLDTFGPPVTASNDFMTALTAKAYAKAYGMILPSQQAAFGGSPEGLQQLITDKQWSPSSFSLPSVHVGTGAQVNGTGVFGGATRYVYITLGKDGDAWKISSLEVSDNAPTPTPAS
jgi:hypothetical protein